MRLVELGVRLVLGCDFHTGEYGIVRSVCSWISAERGSNTVRVPGRALSSSKGIGVLVPDTESSSML